MPAPARERPAPKFCMACGFGRIVTTIGAGRVIDGQPVPPDLPVLKCTGEGCGGWWLTPDVIARLGTASRR